MSLLSTAPTAIDFWMQAGVETPLRLSFPAAATTTTPEATALFITVAITGSSASQLDAFDKPPPRLMLITFAPLLTDHSIPSITLSSRPLPDASSTFTPNKLTFGATPVVIPPFPFPPTVPATWVP
ncbi:Uncharacterised protein [uncultured archaeon]|nr:Uncharacterised protein [uncultured archaeon]